MTMLSIYNSISDYDCYDPEFGAVAVSLGFDLETALETALLAFDCCTPDNTCSYSEHIRTPFGTDEAQCENDRAVAMLMADLDEDLPF